MQQSFWDLCMRGYQEFTERKLLKLTDCSLTLTKETLEQRQKLYERVLELRKTIVNTISRKAQLLK
jgi:hypothetical protein